MTSERKTNTNMHPLLTTRDVTEAEAGLTVYTDSWWLCVDGDPKQALFFGKSPQANSKERLAKHILETNSLYDGMNLKVTHIPVAFVPPRD